MRTRKTPLMGAMLMASLAAASFGSRGFLGTSSFPSAPTTYGGGAQPYQGRGRSRKNRRKSPFRGMTYSAHHSVERHYKLERSVA